MQPDPNFGFEEIVQESMRDLLDTVAARADLSPRRRMSLSQASICTVMSFNPRDPLEIMLAKQCVVYDALLHNGARDMLNGQEEAMKLRARPGIHGSGKIFLQAVEMLMRIQRRPEDQLAFARRLPVARPAADPAEPPEPPAAWEEEVPDSPPMSQPVAQPPPEPGQPNHAGTPVSHPAKAAAESPRPAAAAAAEVTEAAPNPPAPDHAEPNHVDDDTLAAALALMSATHDFCPAGEHEVQPDGPNVAGEAEEIQPPWAEDGPAPVANRPPKAAAGRTSLEEIAMRRLRHESRRGARV